MTAADRSRKASRCLGANIEVHSVADDPSDRGFPTLTPKRRISRGRMDAKMPSVADHYSPAGMDSQQMAHELNGSRRSAYRCFLINRVTDGHSEK